MKPEFGTIPCSTSESGPGETDTVSVVGPFLAMPESVDSPSHPCTVR